MNHAFTEEISLFAENCCGFPSLVAIRENSFPSKGVFSKSTERYQALLVGYDSQLKQDLAFWFANDGFKEPALSCACPHLNRAEVKLGDGRQVSYILHNTTDWRYRFGDFPARTLQTSNVIFSRRFTCWPQRFNRKMWVSISRTPFI